MDTAATGNVENSSLRDALTSAFEQHRDPVAETPAEPISEPVEPSDTPEQSRVRDERGRFAREQKEQRAEQEAQPEETAAVKEPGVPLSIGKKDPLYQKWQGLDPDVKAAWHRRDADVAKLHATYKDVAEFGASVRSVTQPYEQKMSQLGAHPVEVVRTMLETADQLYFGTPQQKAQAIAGLIAEVGLTPDVVAQFAPPQVDPNILALNQKLDYLAQGIQQAKAAPQSHAEQQEWSRLASEVRSFAENHPHFDKVRHVMGALLDSGNASDLEDAYWRAVWADPEIRPQPQQAAQAKSRAVSVTGAPTGKPALDNPADRRAAIMHALRQHI